MILGGKTALVTGATGFLGGALARRLSTDGVRTRALVRHPARANLPAEVELVQGDLTAPDTLPPAAEGCNVVFHCAVSYGSRAEQEAVSLAGTRALAVAAANAGVVRFVHVSSIAVYGYRVQSDVDETTAVEFHSDIYGSTKAAAETIVLEVSDLTGLDYSVIRPALIYGAGSGMWTERLFRVARLPVTPFPGRGNGSAHPVYVDDVVDLMTVLAVHPAASTQVFNCAPDPAPTWREWMQGYQQLAGKRGWLAIPPGLITALMRTADMVTLRRTDLDAYADMVNMMQRRYTYRMDKAKRLLGWHPQVDLAGGIERCALWLRERGLM